MVRHAAVSVGTSFLGERERGHVLVQVLCAHVTPVMRSLEVRLQQLAYLTDSV